MHKRFDKIFPYTYTITRKHDGKIYHGVRFRNVTKLNIPPIEDLGIRYFSSSKYLGATRLNKSEYIFKLKHTFDTIEEALLHENKINRKLIHRNNFINRGAVLTNSSIGIRNPMFGKHHTEETKNKIRITMSGRHRNLDTIRKISEANRGKKRSDIQRQNYSRGIRKSFKMGRVPWNKGKCNCYSKDVLRLQSKLKRGKNNASYGKPAYKGNAFSPGGLCGEKNPRFNKKIMHNKIDKQQLVPNELVQKFISMGWMLGYLNPFINKLP